MSKIKKSESNENYYELEDKAQKQSSAKENSQTHGTVKLPSTYKDYNIKDLYSAEPDLYYGLLKIMQDLFTIQFDTAARIYSTTTEDLQKDTISSVCRIYFTDNKTNSSIVGYAVLYVREKQIEINGDLQLCYIARGSSVIFEEFRGKTQAAGFSIQYLEEFISNNNDKPTFLFSKSVSPLTLYMLMKYMDGYVGLPSTLIELRENDDTQLKDFLTQISIKAPFNLHKVCDSITHTIEHDAEELDIYNQTGRIGFHEGVIQKVEGVVDNNYKKEITFKLFENVNYYYTDGWAIPTIILVDHNTIKLQHNMLKFAESFAQVTKTLSTFSFSTNLLTCCPVNSETEVDHDSMVRNNKIWKGIEDSRRSSIDYSILGRLEDYQKLYDFQQAQEIYEVKIAGDGVDNQFLALPEQ
ncbi:MAG: hypothetical protein J0L79_01400 [Rickettsiales bacterium]|nr:hypothetical protein [Rickettsiales bacterium]